MKQLKLIDRVVVEIKSEKESEELKLSRIANELRYIADEIENGRSTGNEEVMGREYLWGHECRNYGGFRIVSDKSLISQYYYGSEPKPEKYVIIVDKYDRDNSGSYPLDDKIFATED